MSKLKQRACGVTGVVGAWRKKYMVASYTKVPIVTVAPTPQHVTVVYQGLRWGIKKQRSGSKLIMFLNSQINLLRGQIAEAKAAEAATSLLLADSVLKYNAEDWFWRKRYRSLQTKHRRWVNDAIAMKKDKAASEILLELLVKTSEWEGEAATSESVDMEAAVAFAIAAERDKARPRMK